MNKKWEQNRVKRIPDTSTAGDTYRVLLFSQFSLPAVQRVNPAHLSKAALTPTLNQTDGEKTIEKTPARMSSERLPAPLNIHWASDSSPVFMDRSIAFRYDVQKTTGHQAWSPEVMPGELHPPAQQPSLYQTVMCNWNRPCPIQGFWWAYRWPFIRKYADSLWLGVPLSVWENIEPVREQNTEKKK